MAKELPDVGYLRQRLAYDPETGVLTWLGYPGMSARWATLFAGREAGCPTSSGGYRRVVLDGAHYYAQRIAWALHHGREPAAELDHINGDKLDNRLVNMREVSRSGNMRNIPIRVDNTSGAPGVHWHKQHGKWAAVICVAGKSTHLGLFEDVEDAVAVRKAAERQRGFHENHGRQAIAQ